MNRLQLLVILVGLVSFCAAGEENGESSDKDNMMEEDASVERKKNSGMEQMYMMVMMVKSFVSMIMSLISPIIMIKGLGLSAIGTLINVARFIMMLKQQKEAGGGWDSNRRVVALPPHRVHPLYLPQYASDEKI